jgi:putative membrane protein
MRHAARLLSLIGLFMYIAVFPGSTITVALDRVPAWGIWFGGALLMLQGAVALLWLAGQRGANGLLAGLAVGALGCAVEYAGVATGWPFGRYVYTDVLQPQVAGVVPLAICCAWIMAAFAAFQIAGQLTRRPAARWLMTAMLVLVLDLQIETVATRVNHYWEWRTGGLFYGVPLSNFVGWWLTGLCMAWVMAQFERRAGARREHRPPLLRPPLLAWLSDHTLPLLYLLSTFMFTVVNFAYGYVAAGMIGALVLIGAGAIFIRRRGAIPMRKPQRQTGD